MKTFFGRGGRKRRHRRARRDRSRWDREYVAAWNRVLKDWNSMIVLEQWGDNITINTKDK